MRSTSKGHILVADDDPTLCALFRRVLELDGYQVATAGSAPEVLRALDETDYDLLVSDVRMPGTNGVELAGKLKERDDTVPVIVITGHADVPLAIQAMKAGAADFIEKPFDDEAILAAIRKALNESTDDEQKQNERREVLDRLALLSTREREVVDGLVEGKANKMIAFDHDISPRTVEVYRANAMMKMQAKTLSDLVRMVTIARLG